MTVEAITFDENGQGVINFEALELRTDIDFINQLNHAIDEMGYIITSVEEHEYGHGTTFDYKVFLRADNYSSFATLVHSKTYLDSKLAWTNNELKIVGRTEIQKFVSDVGGTIQW
ncbi:hypothetical protein [Bacillus sp. B1-b2]|uniref:hypothetical protein n=1 Tax=Bacillus sp. B1-b2 TaxID=2653201 RepID=UPI001261D80F|nr:hypothetical protein [Bacillus sp. B1-b2]KAB7663029.1 hypothetical protein F9279_24350 [Bacillus sp. B1-b2]